MSHAVRAKIRTLPKVLLHDHLDGGVRPATELELAKETFVLHFQRVFSTRCLEGDPAPTISSFTGRFALSLS